MITLRKYKKIEEAKEIRQQSNKISITLQFMMDMEHKEKKHHKL